MCVRYIQHDFFFLIILFGKKNVSKKKIKMEDRAENVRL